MQLKKVHIGKLLLDKKLITEEQLANAVEQQQSTGQRLGQILVDLHYIQENELLQLLSQQLHIPFIDLKDYSFQPEIVNLLPEFYARHFRAIVLKKEGNEYLVGMVDPQNLIATDEISRILKAPIRLALVNEPDLLHLIDMLYRRTTEISSFAEELSAEIQKSDFNISQLAQGLSSSDAPVVRLLQSIFEDAVQVNATDIHIEPDEHVLRIRQRIDGILHEQILKEKEVVPALTLRLKLMAGINISEKRVPQDGRFSITIKNKNFDVRLATLPIQFGESVVMRLLSQSGGLLDLKQVGMPENILNRLRKIISSPNGIILLTGPTGSGKTTTLYGVLSELNNAEKKIITVEDPVEYRLPRINQVQVATAIDMTFARALRAILRQDPDIVMVGELRDQETVSIALRAAMTGHLVLSTLHTNDAVSSVLRLIDMGAESYLVGATLRAVIAQRLVRRICQNCIQEKKLTAPEKLWIEKLVNAKQAEQTYHAGEGCTYCHFTGYKGQVGVFELLEWDANMVDVLQLNQYNALAEAAKKQETFCPLSLSGLALAEKGITTVSEVIRIVGDIVTDSMSEIIA